MFKLDKVLHFSISACLTLAIRALLGADGLIPAALAVLVGTTLKEAGDYFWKGNADMKDILANVVGIGFAVVCINGLCN